MISGVRSSATSTCSLVLRPPRERFLERIEALVPWARVGGARRAGLPQAGTGSPALPAGRDAMRSLRAALLQPPPTRGQALSDPALEDLLYEAESVRRFCGLTLSGPIPDESTILHFRHLLERHQLGEALLETINAHLAGQGLRLQAGTILDASIIAAPSSTKNQARQRDPRGIWSDRELMLVLDDVKEALFVYDLESGRLLAEHPLDKLNKSPRGIWSDGFTIWVSDDGAKRIFAYRLEEGALVRHEDQEFTFRSLLKAGNGAARGIWSDGEVVYVADEQDDRVYTYNLSDAIDARLASLSLSDVELDEFAAGRPSYTALAAADATVTTVEAIAAQETATVVIAPADADGDAENGHQVALGAETEITIAVTSSDGSRTRSYRVLVEKTVLFDRSDHRASERGHIRRRQRQ